MQPRRGTSSIVQSRVIPAPPLSVFRALADPQVHAAVTGAPATGSARAGTRFTAWDGYISGRTLRATKGRTLVQEWATSEWPVDHAPSRVEWQFAPHARGTRVTLRHTRVPRSQAAAYRKGWIEYYWRPLRAYFAAGNR